MSSTAPSSADQIVVGSLSAVDVKILLIRYLQVDENGGWLDVHRKWMLCVSVSCARRPKMRWFTSSLVLGGDLTLTAFFCQKKNGELVEQQG